MLKEHLMSYLGARLCQLKTSFGHCLCNADDSAKEDCISKLPDEMLSSIISPLTLRDAVRMSSVSKRWRHIYASMSSLDFDCLTMFGTPGDCNSQHLRSHLCLECRNTFVQIVNQSLQLYSGRKIVSFRFSFCFKGEFAGDVDRWISFAVRMGVEKLDLNFACKIYFIAGGMFGHNYNDMYKLSCQLLSEASKLKHLRLSFCTLKLECGVHFNNLISLDLNQVPLSCCELQRILSRCLNLEWLGVRCCSVPGKLCICVPSLKFLGVYCCDDLKEIELSAVNLTTFEFSEISKFSFSNVPKLEKVFFHARYCADIDSIFSELTRDPCHEIKTLSISISMLRVQYIPKCPTSFSNVKQLELFIDSSPGYNLLQLTPILSACPLLRKFHIMMPSYEKYCEESMEEPPKCVHTQLKEVEFGGFSGTRNQIEFAIFLLKNVVSLDLMIFDAHYRLYLGGGKWEHRCISTWTEDKRDEFHKQLQGKVPSVTAEVIIR